MRKATAIATVVLALTCGAATVTETEIEFATYPFFDPDPVPATGDMRYPYFFFDGTSAANAPRAPGRWAQLRSELAAAPAFMDVWPELALRLVGVPLSVGIVSGATLISLITMPPNVDLAMWLFKV